VTTPRFVGVHRNLALFEARGKSVIVNTKTLTAAIETDNFSSADVTWERRLVDPVWSEIAAAAIQRVNTPSDISLAESTKRSYTVPKRVAESAASAVTASGVCTPVADFMSSKLCSGDQVSCEDVLWVSRFFDTHDEETTDRKTWLSWGGNEGKRWSAGLASRLDYDSVVADAGMYETPGVQYFVEGDESERTFWARLNEPLGQFATSLYMLTESGTWQAWGNGDWFDCDEPEFTDEFIELDDEAALYVAGALFDSPDTGIDLRTPNPEAWDLAVAAYDDIDWTLADRAVVAAPSPVTDPQIGYTPQERSQNAEKQVRDANGRFAEVGAKGAIKSSGIGGTIQAANTKTGEVTVTGDDGQTYTIPAKDFEVGAAPHPKVDPSQAKDSVDFEGILAPAHEPPQPRAQLNRDGKVLGPVQINDTLDQYSGFITAARQAKARAFKKILDTTPPEGTDDLTSVQAAGASTDTGATPENDVPPPTPDPTPDNSDVQPIYLAIVDRDDPRAVMDLVALVPATATSSEPKTFRRAGGKWVEDNKILQDLRSATPPPIVQLTSDQLQDVLGQVDMEGTNPPPDTADSAQSITASAGGDDDEDEEEDENHPVTAAGGLDRNRGNAETLRHYWTVGPGGLKIRWNTGGDWTRCVRLLSKHLGPRAKGYCALRHKEMTGMWPGDRRNREMSSPALTAGGSTVYSTDQLLSHPAVLRASAAAAARDAAVMRVRGGEFNPIPPSAEDISDGRSGRAFRIPLVIPEGLATGDGRTFGRGALGMRNLPLPLMWQIQTGEGHDGSVLVGRIDRVERTDDGLGNAYGVFDIGPYGQEAQRLVESGMLRWISADLDKFEVDESKSDPETGQMFIKKGRLMGVTLVPKPAFQECTIELVPVEETQMPMDAVPSVISASASIAAAIPVEPPSIWFDRPVLNGPTPITVDDNGHIFGHIATWDINHIGMAGQVRAPRSASNYAYFHTGVVRTAEGNDVKVGQLTLAGGHAPIHLDAALAVRHYDDTASAIADVHAGEDAYGIYVSGALRPGTTPEQIRALRASAPSGDWRAINGRLEMVAVCQVNVPGFPVPRSLAASGAMTALVAAGSATLMAIRAEENKEEQAALVAAAQDRLDRVLDIDGYMASFKNFSEEKRQKLAKEGKALPDGSYPIENAGDLRRAIRAYGRAPQSKRAQVRRHIVKWARKFGKADLIPQDWKEASFTDETLENRLRYDAMVASARAARVAQLRDRVNPPSKDELAARVEALRSRVQK
jgi:hypothetical protein